jgi:hypothetical protein
VRVPAPQETGAAREPQEPEQDPDRQSIRDAQPEGPMQRLVKRRAFFDPFDGLCLEFEPAFGTGDSPASQLPFEIAENFNNRIRQRRRQRLSLIPGDIEEPPATTGIVPKAKLAVRSAGFDAKDF